MRKIIRCLVLGVFCCMPCAAQDESGEESGDGGGNDMMPVLAAPEFDAKIAIGFNYDFLKDPTRVNFDYPRGYIGLNIPLSYGLDKKLTDQMTSGLAGYWQDGDEFEPTASAKQNANTTIRVDMPMLRGVGEFANIQNFYFKYTNTLGEPKLLINPAMDSIDIMLQGMISVPLEIGMGWETLMLGYAYKFNDLFKIGINLNRHIFRFDLAAKINIDLLGYLEFNMPQAAPATGDGAVDEMVQDATQDILGSIGRQWINYMVSGEAKGHYEAEVWSPTFAMHFWRLGCVARLGIDTKAPGSLSAKYVVPFFVNPENFQVAELDDPTYIMDNINRFLDGETDSIEYSTDNDLEWKMPTGLSFTFDIVPDKFYISYTKFFGEISMFVGDIVTINVPQGASADTSDATTESVDFDLGVKVDHIIMLHGAFQNAFCNAGIFTLDIRYGDMDNLLENVYPVPVFGGALLPVLNFGTTFGSKIRLLLELDVLPLSALKTGIIYSF